MTVFEPGWELSGEVQRLIGLPEELARQVAEEAAGEQITSSNVIVRALERFVDEIDQDASRSVTGDNLVYRRVTLPDRVNEELEAVAQSTGLEANAVATGAVTRLLASTSEFRALVQD